tara:strand:- start:88324 stop:89844 length:1521 start_codon:yes stop_codon:yes gene_type:complete
MEHTNNLQINKWSVSGYLLVLMILVSTACEAPTNQSLNQLTDTKEISLYDNNPIVEIKAVDFIRNSEIESFKSKIAKQFGPILIDEFNKQLDKAKMVSNPALRSDLFLLNELDIKAKSNESLSTHYRIVGDSGKSEDFLFGIRKFISSPEKLKTKDDPVSADTWLALDPDKFYLEDVDDEELWPIEIEAIHLTDPDRKLKLTFDRTGLISAVEDSRFKSESISDPNILMLDAVPVLDACTEALDEGCNNPGTGGGTGSSPTNRINDWSRGEITGVGTPDVSTYFVLKGIQLVETGDAGTAELQLFAKKSNNDLHNLPVSYRYRFDRVVRINPYYNGVANSVIQGADWGGTRNAYYHVPDIENKGQYYDFDNIIRYETYPNGFPQTRSVDYFPLFNLTLTDGPWRFVLVDDDKDYADFSSRRMNKRVKNIHTYDMGSGTWGIAETGFTTRNHRYGSSDDPITQSGVRNITLPNAMTRMGTDQSMTISKWHGTDIFTYSFGLESYNIY